MRYRALIFGAVLAGLVGMGSPLKAEAHDGYGWRESAPRARYERHVYRRSSYVPRYSYREYERPYYRDRSYYSGDYRPWSWSGWGGWRRGHDCDD